jgi:excisionase family DNA binding protein
MGHPAQAAGSHVIDVMTVAEVASMLRVSKMTVYRLLEIGEIRSFRVGRSFRIQHADVVDYLRRSQLGGPAESPHHGAEGTHSAQGTETAGALEEPADGPRPQVLHGADPQNG